MTHSIDSAGKASGPPRPCPICNGLFRNSLRNQRFIDGPLGDVYQIVVCNECGCGFADGIPCQAELDRYYSEQSRYTYAHLGGMESSWDFKRFETTIAHLKPLIGSFGSRILDIGCATGGLLSVLVRSGYSNVLGVDPSPSCAAAAMKIHGVPVRVASVSELCDWPERFDLILMLGVLEHVRDASAAIGLAKSLLNRGGLLYCAVPDVEGFVECPDAPYQQFSLEHVNFFSTTSLNNLLSVSGMAPVKSWRWTTEWRQGVMEPIASGLFVSSPGTKPRFDATTLPALSAYIDRSSRGDQDLVALIDSLKDSQEPIVVWGAGTLARRLLASTSLSAANISAFVDSNPQLQGKMLAGRPILAPEVLRSRSEAILICSGPFRMEILGAIRELRLPNRIISFDP